MQLNHVEILGLHCYLSTYTIAQIATQSTTLQHLKAFGECRRLEVQTEHQNGEEKGISVILNVARLLVPDGLV